MAARFTDFSLTAMEITDLFKKLLTEKTGGVSKLTLKNYLSDLRHFISWYENTKGLDFSPKNINSNVISLYEASMGAVISEGNLIAETQLSTSSMKRHLSSLRKFFEYMKSEGIITENPFFKLPPATNSQLPTDYWHLRSFQDSLLNNNSSRLTVKNYLSDIQSFARWYEESILPTLENPLTQTEGFYIVSSDMVEEYKKRLIEIQGAAPRTINRKLSSLRKYLEFASKKGFISPSEIKFNPLNLNIPSPASQGKALQAQREGFSLDEIRDKRQETKDERQNSYSPFPPIRLLQKLVIYPYLNLEEIIASSIAALLAGKTYTKGLNLPKKALNSLNAKGIVRAQNLTISGILGARNVGKEFFAPASISLRGLPLYKKLIHHARFTRPDWYKRYHNYTFVHYLHFTLLVIFASGVGAALYQNLIAKKQTPTFAAATAPPRIMSFQGRLTDNLDNPITTPTDVRFALYNDLTASGAALLWQEVQYQIAPDQDGIFSVLLGNVTPITSTVFSDNSSIYLGVTIRQTSELTPRQRVASVAYATNAEFLQGQPPTTQAGITSYKNVILALDSSGNLTLSDSVATDHVFQANNGIFKISGQPLVLATNTGTNSHVSVIPDGLGKIDLQKPLVNMTTMGNLVPGGVEINDKFGVLATESAVAAFVVNNNTSGGDIFTASSSGTPRFTIANDGTLTSAIYTAQNGVLYGTQTTGVLAQATTASTSLCLLSGASNPAWGACPGGAQTIDAFWNQTNGLLYPNNSTVDFAIGGQSSASAKFAVYMSGTKPTASVSGRTSFAALLVDNAGSGDLIAASASGVPNFIVQNNGNIIVGQGGNGKITAAVIDPYLVQNQKTSGTVSLTFQTMAASNGDFIYQNQSTTLATLVQAGQFQLPITGSTGGITLGGDVQIFQGTANRLDLASGDSLNLVSGSLLTGGTTRVDSSGNGTLANLTVTGNCSGCTNATNSPLQMLSGAIVPLNSTLDFLIGEQSSTSAVLKVTGQGNPFAGTLVGASVSANTSFAGLLVDNRGLGDIFTASTGGVPKFTIKNSGALQFSNYKIAGGIFYADGSGNFLQTTQGGGAQCLIGGATPSWGTCGSGGSSFWDQSSLGLLYPGNSTVDLAIGGTSSTSAKFLFANVNSGTPTLKIFNEAKTQSLNLSHDGTDGNIISTTGKVNIGQGGGTLYLETDIKNVSAILAGAVKISDKLLVQNSESAGNALAIFDNLGAGDIIAASASGAWKFSVTNNGTASSAAGFTIDGVGNIQSTNGQALTVGGGTSGNLILGLSGKNITLPGYTSQNGVLYGTQTTGVLAQATTASTNLCLVSGVSNPSWASCPGGGTTDVFWGQSSGLLYPNNSTVDFAIGGQSSASAKFAVLNVNGSASPIASVSATTSSGGSGNGIVIGGDGTIQSLRNNTLTLGGNTTGEIQIGTDALARRVFVGNTTGASGLTLDSGTGAINIGTSIAKTLTIGNTTGATAVNINSGTGNIALASTSTGDITLNSADTLLLDSAGVLELNSSAGVISIGNDAVAQNINIGNGAAARTITIGNITGATAVNVNTGTGGSTITTTGAGDFTVSSGDDVTINGAGANAAISIGTSAVAHTIIIGNETGASSLELDSGTGSISIGNAVAKTINIGNSTGATALNLDTGTGGINFGDNANIKTIDIGGVTSSGTDTINIATEGTAADVLSIGNSNASTTVAITGGNDWSITAAGALTVASCTGCGGVSSTNSPFQVLSGAIVPLNSTLDTILGGQASTSAAFRVTGQGNPFAGTLSAASISANTSFAGLVVDNKGIGDLFTASSSGVTQFVITNNGAIGIGTNLPGAKLDVNGSILLGANSTIDVRSSGTLAIGNTTATTITLGRSGQGITLPGFDCSGSGNGGKLTTTSGGILTCSADGGGGGGSNWTLSTANGTLSPNNNTLDFLYGGTATSSAKFSILNLAGGTPTASISATTTGAGLSLAGDGTIQSLRNNTLTIGGNTTGNISFNPGNIGEGRSLYLSSNGTVGIGTALSPTGVNPQAMLQVYSNLGTLPAASISGKTAAPALLVTQDGDGDLFVASYSAGIGLRAYQSTAINGYPVTLDVGPSALGKINAAFVDPPYTIDGLGYSTWMNSMLGLNEEMTGTVLPSYDSSQGAYAYKLDFNNFEYQSDHWVFNRIIDPDIGKIRVLLTPNSKAKTWYKKDGTNRIITFYADRPVELSYRLSAPRFDSHRGPTFTGIAMGLIVPPPTTTGSGQNDNNFEVDPYFATLTINEENGQWILKDSNRNAINQTEAFSKAIIANIQGGFSSFQKSVINNLESANATISSLTGNTLTFTQGAFSNLTASFSSLGNATAQTFAVQTENFTIAGKSLQTYISETVQNILNTSYLIPNTNIVSPLASIDQIHTNVISPLADNGEVKVNAKLVIAPPVTASDSAAVLLEVQGSASISGNLTAQNATISGNLATQTINTDSIQINADATVSGTLETNTLVSNNASISGNLAAGNISANQLSISGNLSLGTIRADFGIFEQGITSLGPITATQITAMDTLSVGESFTISNNAINTVGADLEIQSLRQGNISFMGGLIKIDTQGNMDIGGNLNVLGNIAATKGVFDRIETHSLAADIISPLANNALVIARNGSDEAISGIATSATGETRDDNLLDVRGSFTASGSGTFSKLNFNLVGEALASSLTEAVATGSAGFATLRQGQPELTIKNANVTEKSLIYITPFGDTNNKVIYLLRQIPNTEVQDGSFTVGVSGEPTTKDTQFNWLIVN